MRCVQKNNSISSMNRKECSVLRGIAILCIILHNYCHWLLFAVYKNEFSFYFNFWNSIQWNTMFFQFFSFWGHLGVPVLVMLSGYGLVLKYDKTTINKRSFILKHYKKLCIPMIGGLIFYYIIQYLINDSIHFDVTDIIPVFGFTYFTWLLIPLLIAFAANNLVTFLPKCLVYFFGIFGEKSLYIFVLHPLARELTIRQSAN